MNAKHSIRETILAAIASGQECRFTGPVQRIQHEQKSRGYYNIRGVSVDGQTAVIPLGMLNAALAKAKGEEA